MNIYSVWASASDYKDSYDFKKRREGEFNLLLGFLGHQVIHHFWWLGWHIHPFWNGISITSFSYLFFLCPPPFFFLLFCWHMLIKNSFFVETKLNKNRHGLYLYYLYFIKMACSCQRPSNVVSQHCCVLTNWWLLSILINKMFLSK